MKKNKKSAKVSLIVLVLLLLNACFAVRVVEDVKNPDQYFKNEENKILIWLE